MQYENELEDLVERHETEYTRLIEETALRATGGVSICDEETHKYLSRQNRSASFNTRRPRVEVMRLRENAARLRDLGRVDEANEFAVRAAKMDEEDEHKWREQTIESCSRAGRSLLQRQLWTQARRALSASSPRPRIGFAREARRG